MSQSAINDDDKDSKTQNPLSIDLSQWRESLCFTETLLICDKNELSSSTKSIGSYCISVESIGPRSREFLVTVAASMEVGTQADCLMGRSRIVGTCSENLQCLEEKRTEVLHCRDGENEKNLYILKNDDFYYVMTLIRCGSLCESNSITVKTDKKFITEAGNIILMRFLALSNYHGLLTFQSMTIDGGLEISEYRCTSVDWTKVDDKFYEAYTVERRRRKILKTGNSGVKIDAEFQESKSLLTAEGKLMKHEWLNLPFVLRMNRRLDSTRMKFDKCKDVQRPLKETWPDCMELASKYLDRKSCGIDGQKDYFRTHPEITKLVSDYIQTLLIVQPSDVIEFTIQHFKAFTRHPH